MSADGYGSSTARRHWYLCVLVPSHAAELVKCRFLANRNSLHRVWCHDLRVLCKVFNTHTMLVNILFVSACCGSSRSPVGVPCLNLLGRSFDAYWWKECLRNLLGIWNCSWLVRSHSSVLYHCTRRFVGALRAAWMSAPAAWKCRPSPTALVVQS